MSMKTNVERFEIIVRNAKEMALEAGRLEERLKEVEAELARRIRERVESDVKVAPGKMVPHTYPDEVEDHSSETQGFYAITQRAGSDDFEVIIHHINPTSGRDTTAGGVAPTLVEAVVLRNKRASDLLREGLIDFERYLKIVRG